MALEKLYAYIPEPREDSRPSCPPLSRRGWMALGVIILLGAALRLHALGRFSFWYDEGATLMGAVQLGHPWRYFDIQYSLEPPLYFVLTACWQLLVHWLPAPPLGTEAHDAFFRLPSWGFGVLSLPLVFFAARTLMRRNLPAYAATLLVAISPFQIYYAQEFRAYTLYACLALAALICMLHALETGRRASWVGMVAFLSMGMYIHYFFVLVIAVFNVYFLAALPWHKRRLPAWALSQCAVLLLTLPAFYLASLMDSVSSQAIEWYPPLTFKDGLLTFKTFLAGYSPAAVYYRPLVALGFAAFALGLWSLRRQPRTVLFLLAATILPIAACVTMWQFKAHNYYQHRLFIFCSFAFAMGIGAGVSALPRHWQQILALAVCCLLTIPLLGDTYAQRQHPSPHHRLGVRYKAANREVAAQIRAHFEPGDAIAHSTQMTFMPMYWYYLPQEQYMAGFGRQDVRNLVNSFPVESLWRQSKSIPERLEDIIRGKQRLWFTVSWWEMGELPAYARLMVNWLDHHAVREQRLPFDDITLYRYQVLDGGDACVPVERLADYGDITLPSYDRVKAPEARGWRESYERTAASLAQAPPPVIGLSMDASSFPSELEIANGTEFVQSLTCSAFLSADTFTAAAFQRLSPTEESWRPINTWELKCDDTFDDQSMAVFFEPGDPDQCSIFAESDLPQGTYTVMARVLEGGDTSAQAALHFEAASLAHLETQTEVGAYTPQQDGVPLHWEWVPVGKFASAGGPFRLLITAIRPGTRDYASAGISRIVLLPDQGDAPAAVAPVQQWKVELQPHKTSRLALPQAALSGPHRVDIVLSMAEGPYLRSIWFYTPPAS